MEESNLSRKMILKTMVVGSAALLLAPAKGVAAARLPTDVPLYHGQPSIGEPGYEERINRIFQQASVKKV